MLFQFAEYAMGRSLMHAINPSDHQAAFDRVITETSSVVGSLNTFAQALVIAILEAHVGMDCLHQSLEEIELGAVPMSTSVDIPFYFEVPVNASSPQAGA